MGVRNHHPVLFGLNSGFFLDVGDTETVFWFKNIFLEVALVFKVLYVFGLVSNVEEELLCFYLVNKLLCRRWLQCE